MAFGVLAFSQVLRAVNQRSDTDPVRDREGGRNPQLAWAVAASTALMLVVLLVPPVREAFGGAAMDAWQWATVLGPVSYTHLAADRLGALAICRLPLPRLRLGTRLAPLGGGIRRARPLSFRGGRFLLQPLLHGRGTVLVHSSPLSSLGAS